MYYNWSVRNKSDLIRLLRIACVLWIGYLCLSASVDFVLRSPGPPQLFYYETGLVISLLVLGITYWDWLQKKLGSAFLPFVITLICGLPIVTNQILIRYLFTTALPSPEAALTRVVPFLVIALLLLAWQYRWQAGLVFCIVIGLINIGLLGMFSTGSDAFVNGLTAVLAQVIIFGIVGFFISVIISWLRRQSEALSEANSRLTHYAETLEDLAVTRERSRIAQELHDTLSHTLSGLSVQLETMKAYWEIDRNESRKMLDKSLAVTRAGLEETRRAVMALRAKPLEELGLEKAILEMAKEAASHSGMKLDISVSSMPALSPSLEQCIYRVAQESITNVLRHAHASNLRVQLEKQNEAVLFAIEDDGIGFKVQPEMDRHHFGLTGMKERAELANGHLKITSNPGRGTRVELEVSI